MKLDTVSGWEIRRYNFRLYVSGLCISKMIADAYRRKKHNGNWFVWLCSVYDVRKNRSLSPIFVFEYIGKMKITQNRHVFRITSTNRENRTSRFLCLRIFLFTRHKPNRLLLFSLFARLKCNITVGHRLLSDWMLNHRVPEPDMEHV